MPFAGFDVCIVARRPSVFRGGGARPFRCCFGTYDCVLWDLHSPASAPVVLPGLEQRVSACPFSFSPPRNILRLSNLGVVRLMVPVRLCVGVSECKELEAELDCESPRHFFFLGNAQKDARGDGSRWGVERADTEGGEMLVEMSLAVSDDGAKGGESSVSDSSSSSTTSGCWRGSGNGAKRILDIAMVVVGGSRGRCLAFPGMMAFLLYKYDD